MQSPGRAGHVARLGFDLVEFPVRPGFPCTPERVDADWPQVVKMLGGMAGHREPMWPRRCGRWAIPTH